MKSKLILIINVIMLSMVLCACGGPRTHIPEKDLVSIARDVIAGDIELINKEKLHKDLIAYTFRDRYDRDFTFTSVIYPATGIDGVHIYGYVTKVETTYFKQLWISYADEIKSIIAEFEEGKGIAESLDENDFKFDLDYYASCMPVSYCVNAEAKMSDTQYREAIKDLAEMCYKLDNLLKYEFDTYGIYDKYGVSVHDYKPKLTVHFNNSPYNIGTIHFEFTCDGNPKTKEEILADFMQQYQANVDKHNDKIKEDEELGRYRW